MVHQYGKKSEFQVKDLYPSGFWPGEITEAYGLPLGTIAAVAVPMIAFAGYSKDQEE